MGAGSKPAWVLPPLTIPLPPASGTPGIPFPLYKSRLFFYNKVYQSADILIPKKERPMENILLLLTNCLVALYDMILFMSLNTPRGDAKRAQRILWAGCIGMVLCYFAVTCLFDIGMVPASVLCMSLPSLILFWLFSAHRGARFILTFCLADSTAYIVGFFARLPGLAFPRYKASVDLLCTVALFSALLLALHRLFPKYRALLELPRKGWWDMAAASAMIYLAQIATTSAIDTTTLLQDHPRLLAALGLWCAASVCCYVVFVRAFSMISTIHSQTEQLIQEKKYHAIAYTDTLTGLDNRAAYTEHCADVDRLEPAARGEYTALFLDLDGFKQINDRFGHIAGDTALQHIATALREAFHGPEYRIFRYGGDEFVVTAAGVSPQALQECLQLVREKLADIGAEFPLNISCGMARLSPDDTLGSAVARADKAMYADKNDVARPASH